MKAMVTPWGPAQVVKDLGLGVLKVYTASHGGVYVPPELLVRIPAEEREYAARWSGSEQWYEEDVAVVIPMLRIREAFPMVSDEAAKKYHEAEKHYWMKSKSG